MHADCLAVVDGQRGTFWTAAATCDLMHAAQSLAAQEHSKGRELQLIKSYVNYQGAEVFIELMTPWARKALEAAQAQQPKPAAAVVEVWHANEPMFGLGPRSEVLKEADFTRCADVLVPHDVTQPERSLDRAFAVTQNIDEAWRVNRPCRSTSVGDVLVLSSPEGRVAYRVENIGFEKVVFESATKVNPDWA